jgi:transcriptional regulator with XRE-family HTH domain
MKQSQASLARKLGISKSYLSMILSGQRQCPTELQAQIEKCSQRSQNQAQNYTSQAESREFESRLPLQCSK